MYHFIILFSVFVKEHKESTEMSKLGEHGWTFVGLAFLRIFLYWYWIVGVKQKALSGIRYIFASSAPPYCQSPVPLLMQLLQPANLQKLPGVANETKGH